MHSDDGHLVPVAIELWTPDEGSEDGPVRVFTPVNTDKQARSRCAHVEGWRVPIRPVQSC